MKNAGKVISLAVRNADAKWRLPIRLFGWLVIVVTFGATASNLLSPPSPDLDPVIPIVRAADRKPVRFIAERETASLTAAGEPVNLIISHVPMPTEVRGFYMTSESAASKVLRTRLLDYAERNSLNAVVIDVKERKGALSFLPQSPALIAHAPAKPMIPDLETVLQDVGSRHLYRIARIAVFRDPDYVRRNPKEALRRQSGGIWTDSAGMTWVDAGSTSAWRYNAEIAKEAYARGFDEVQFDYIRFPSDGNLKAISYPNDESGTPKHEVLRQFFAFLHDELEVKTGIPVSFDLFGYTTWYADDDLGIGQLMRDALPEATVISPMIYPSHYTSGALGFRNPADHPYEITDHSLKSVNKLYLQRDKECSEIAAGTYSTTSTLLMPCNVALARQRPWIQAFDIGAVYDAPMIEAQIKAIRDNGGQGFILWNAHNVYRDFDAAASSGKKEPASAS